MKKTKKIYNLIPCLMAVLLMIACTQDHQTADSVRGDIIQLSVVVNEVTRAAVSADVYPLQTPTLDKPLNADIWLSTSSCLYPGYYGAVGVSDDGSYIDAHRTISYISGAATLPSAYNGEYLRYPANQNTDVYCIGLYPQDTWRTSYVPATGVSATIDGTKDLMFAPEISGCGRDPLVNTRQTFHHLLTWLKVRVRADELSTGDTWGKLREISVTSKNQLTINDLKQATPTIGGEDTKMVLFEDATGYTLNTTSEEKGSVLVAPVDASLSATDYTLHIVCEHHSKDIPINLVGADGNPFTGWTTGKVFVITLRFATLSYIEGTVTLEPWVDEYRDLILKNE